MNKLRATLINEDNIAEHIAKICDRLVGPALVAIYDDRQGEAEPYQSGTGFVVKRSGHVIFVTAHHCLFGQNLDNPESPGDKCIFVDGALRRVGEVALSECAYVRDHDVAVMRVAGFQHALPEDVLLAPYENTAVVAVHGFLSRDFKRTRAGGGILKPKPFIFQQPSMGVEEGYLSFKFPRKGVVSGSKTRAVSPIPRGLSGGPIVDSIALARGQVGIAGVFTEWDQGIGKGATRQIINLAIDRLDDR